MIASTLTTLVTVLLMTASALPGASPEPPDRSAAPPIAASDTTTLTPLPYYPDGVQSVDVNGRTIAYVERPAEERDAPVLLMVHGLGSNLSLWRDHIDAFPEYRVLALDLPGFGLSEKKEVPATMPFFAETVVGFLDKMDVETATYVGVSMGGQVGLHVALSHGDRLDRLALVSPAGIETFTDKDAAAIRNMMSAEGIMAANEMQVRQSVALNFHEYTEQYDWLVKQRHAVADRNDFAAYAAANARAVGGMLDGAVYDRLGEIDVPVLAMFGAGDRLIPNRFLHPDQSPQSIAEDAQAAMPGARVEVVRDAGHLVMVERPDRFDALLRSFLNDTDAAGF
jgi:pimeloyl-ACP methyl ester carboxylesterase